MNARWLERWKDPGRLYEMEGKLTEEGVKQSGRSNQFLAYIRALQTGGVQSSLRSFYNTEVAKREDIIRVALDPISP